MVLDFVNKCKVCVILCIYNVFAMDVFSIGPSFVREPPNHVYFSNSSGAVVNCIADGRPYPTVTWTKQNGERLRDMAGLRYVRHDNALVFSPFASEDYSADVHSATYRCIASNTVGTVGSIEVHARAVLVEDYEIRLPDQYVLQGNAVILHCPVPPSLLDVVRVFSWERGDGLIITHSSSNEKYVILENGDLYIHGISNQTTSWKFRCHTTNSASGRKISSNFAKITITESHHNQPPRIMQRSSNVSSSVGLRATLSCLAQGHPAPLYRWHKLVNNQPLNLATSSAKQTGGVLTFQKLMVSDRGRYLCHVSNHLGQDSVEMQLNVEESIFVTISPKELQADVGDTVTFNCNISGGYVDAVVWRKDMKPLIPSHYVLFHSSSVVQLRQLKRQDSGMYQCFVHRRSDCYQASARLSIRDVAPYFMSTFSERTVRPGSYVSLACVVMGHPEPRLHWTLDGLWPLSTRPGRLVSSYLSRDGSSVIGHLNLTAADTRDGGVYSCEASNEAGTVRHEKRLNVFGPVFIRAVDNATAVAGTDFKMTCPFGGFPFQTIKWKKDGKSLPLNQRQRTYSNGTLTIADVQPGTDAGTYNCEVHPGHGMEPISRSFRIDVKVGPKVSSMHFREDLHEGMRTAIVCLVLAGDGPLTTEWLKDGHRVSERELNVKLLIEEDGLSSTLTFKNLTRAHSGNYTCVSKNDVATASFSTVLTVKVPPRWLVEPSDTSAVTGRFARIDCQAEGVPQPHVRWKVASDDAHDQFRTVVSGSRVQVLSNGSLHFLNVDTSDGGRYLCEANNGLGEGLSAVVHMTVHSAPHFLNKFLVTSVRRGEKATLLCDPDGDRPVVFSWKRNGIPVDLQTDTRYTISSKTTSGEEQSLLTIEKAERKDSGVITCSATNEFGEDSMDTQVIVQDIPDAPQSLEILDLSSRSARLTWKEPFDGNFPITRYTVMWRQAKGQTTGGPLYVPGSETSVIVRGLGPNTRYFFRVKCENTLGESQFGAEVAATTMEEPPAHPPVEVRAVPTSSRSVNVIWQSSLEETSSIDGFYVGFKPQRSADPYIFKSVARVEEGVQQYELGGLSRNIEYSVVVQAYNGRGAGPPSQQVVVRTLEFDRPDAPVIRSYFATSNSLKLSWTTNNHPSAPVSGYILHYKPDNGQWQEVHLDGSEEAHSVSNLQCGTAYRFYMEAFNGAGTGNGSDIVSVKTDGSPPVAPDKRVLLFINSTSVTINLRSWHDGGCSIEGFALQYRTSGHREWTMISEDISPERGNFTLSELQSGTWYSLLMTARNNAGATDAEYVFATLTPSGEIPPRPSMVSNASSGSFYKHLTVTVPVVSSVVVLLVVLCALCLVTRRKSPSSGSRNTNDYRSPGKSENPQVTFETGHESIYLPEPYAMDEVSGYTRGYCEQNADTFGSSRSTRKFSGPGTAALDDKRSYIYEHPVLFAAYQHERPDMNRNGPVYEVPSTQKTKPEREKSWSSSNRTPKPEKDQRFQRPTSSPGGRLNGREEAFDSETECDRIVHGLNR